MLGRPSRSVVTIRTVCCPVSEAKFLNKTDTEFHFWPLNVVLTLFCVVDNELREIESWGPQTSVNGTIFIPSYRTIYWNFVAIYSKQMYPRHCATNRKVTGSIPDGVIGLFL